jgi:hypothetical protein
MKHLNQKLALLQTKYTAQMVWLYVKREWYLAQLIFLMMLDDAISFILRK